MCVYGLIGRISGQFDARDQLAGMLRFGRFSAHIDAATALLPRPVVAIGGVNLELPGHGTDLARYGYCSWLPHVVTAYW